MSKSSDDIFRLREQIEPSEPFTRGGLSGYKRAELEHMLEEQANTIASMKRVFYRDTEELRDQLMVLNAENRCLKEQLAEYEKAPPAVVNEPAPTDEQALRERLRPIVEKLQIRHQQELACLRNEMRSLTENLQQTTQTQEELRANCGAQNARRQAAEYALEIARKEMETLKAQHDTDGETIAHLQATVAATVDGNLDELHSRHIQEYKQALAAAMKQNAQQEEIIHALTQKIDTSAIHYREQRAQQLDYLRKIRESFDMFFEFMAPEETQTPQPQPVPRDNLKPLFKEKQGG
jgi:chromosome segregation ATPase